MIHKDKERVCK